MKNRKTKYLLYFLLFSLVLFTVIMLYFYNVFLEKEKERNRISFNPVMKIEKKNIDFKEENIKIINKRLIKEKNNSSYQVKGVLKSQDYKKIMTFNKKFINEIEKNFKASLPVKKNSYCEIIINTKKRIYDFLDCYPDHIFQRYVALSINKFNDNFNGYNNLENLNTKIKITYYHKGKGTNNETN